LKLGIQSRTKHRLNPLGQCGRYLIQAAIKQNLSLSRIKERIKSLTPATSTPPTASARLASVSQKLKGNKLLEDPKKQKRLDKLLQELESLVGE
jgi:ParB family chromosome partitioning protein